MNPNLPHIPPFYGLLLIAFMVSLATRRARIPYALALVVTGLVVGRIPWLLPSVHLEPSLLFGVFLPPLLFESALMLRLDDLRRDWKPITVYTLAGVLLSSFLVGVLTAWLLHIALAPAFVFGALISATDPISVIAVFKRLGAGRRLTTIMEAESLFNDGVAVVVFTVALSLVGGQHVSAASACGLFVQLVVGGTLVGGLIGLLASRVHYELDDHLVEITLTTVAAFGSYFAAEVLHVSGVIAVVTAGLVIGSYGMPATMTPGTRLAVGAFWEYAAFVVNSLVFLLIGIEIAYVTWTSRVGLVLGLTGVVLIGRMVIYPLSLVVNRVGGQIPRAWQHVLVWGGLRGALSMALALGLPHGFPQREGLIVGTFGVVLFSLLVQGSTLGPLMQRLKLGRGRPSSYSEHLLASEMVATQAGLAEIERLRHTDAHPDWTLDALAQEYGARLRGLEHTSRTAQSGTRSHEQQYLARARTTTLLAEKSALLDAQQQDTLPADAVREIAARIDAEIDVLRKERLG